MRALPPVVEEAIRYANHSTHEGRPYILGLTLSSIPAPASQWRSAKIWVSVQSFAPRLGVIQHVLVSEMTGRPVFLPEDGIEIVEVLWTDTDKPPQAVLDAQAERAGTKSKKGRKS